MRRTQVKRACGLLEETIGWRIDITGKHWTDLRLNDSNIGGDRGLPVGRGVRIPNLLLATLASKHYIVPVAAAVLENRAHLLVIETVSAKSGFGFLSLSTRLLRHIHEHILPETLLLVAIALTLPIMQAAVFSNPSTQPLQESDQRLGCRAQ